MPSNADACALNDAVQAAIAEVLAAERDAREAIGSARLEVEPDRRGRPCRSPQRWPSAPSAACAPWSHAFERQLADRLAAIDAAGGTSLDVAQPLADEETAALQRAVRALAARADRSAAVIECGSLEYAHARLHARHGQRAATRPTWRRIEVIREFAPLLEGAQASALRPWLVGITADSSAHQVEATLRDRWRALVDERAAWMPSSLAACAAVVQGAARSGAAAASGARRRARRLDARRQHLARAVRRAAAGARRAAGGRAVRALAAAWSTPQSLRRAWHDEWRRRLPQPRRDAGDMLQQLWRAAARASPGVRCSRAGEGWLLRGALRARLSLLFRRAALQPAAAFIDLALCALDLERLRAELLRRAVVPRWQVSVMLRPRPARWFEILAARDDATLVLEALGAHRGGGARGAPPCRAAGGAQRRDAAAGPIRGAVGALSRLLAAAPSRAGRPTFPEAPLATLQRCLATIRAWAAGGRSR